MISQVDGRALRSGLILSLILMSIPVLLPASTAVAATPQTITYVCANNSTGQLFYLTPSCAKSQTSVSVMPAATQFKACTLGSNGVTRKVSSNTQCSNAPRTKEITIPKVPADSDSLYFCVSSKDGTMYFQGASPPMCPTGQFAVVIPLHNRPPVANADAYSTDEDTTLNVDAQHGVLSNDSDPDGNAITAVLVSGPSHKSSFMLNSDGSFSYTPAANYNGSDSFTYKDSDGTSTGNTVTVSLTINAVNDPPVNTVPDAQTTDEDTALVFSSGNANQISTSDVDAGALGVQITLWVSHGTLTLSGTSGLSFTTGDGTNDTSMVFAGTVANVNAALNGMSYLPDSNYNGSDSLSFATNDQGHSGSGGPLSDSSSVGITVNAVNDPPVNTVPGSQSVDENTTLSFSSGNSNQISTSDVDAGSSPVKITLSVSHGKMSLSGTSGLTFTTGGGANDASMVFTGTLSDVNTALNGLVYTPATNYSGPDSFSFTTNDQGATGSGGAKSDTDTVAITVNQVNQPPVNIVPGPQNTNEDTALVFSSAKGNQILTSDPDAGTSPVKITLSVSHGTLTLSGTSGLSFSTGSGTSDTLMVFAGSISDVNAALDGMSYLPDSNYSGSDTLSFTTDDQGSTGSGGAKSDTDTVTIGINAVNDPPVNTVPDAQTTDEDTALVFSSGNANQVSTSDVDAGSSLMKITLLVSHGTITLSGTTGLTFITGDGTNDASTVFTGTLSDVNAALDGLSYQPSLNYNGVDTLSLTTDDQGATGSGGAKTATDTVAITISAVNDAPVNSVPGPQQVFSNGTLTFSSGNSNQISTSDVDAGSDPVEVTFTATHGTMTLSGTSGLSFTTGDGTNDASMVFTGTLSDVNAALNGTAYKPDTNYAGPASVQITTNDQGHNGSGGPLSDTDSVSIDVINPPPVATNDDYSATPAVGNTKFTVGITSPTGPVVDITGSVVSNDSDPDGESISAGPSSISSAHGGSVTMNSDGSFTYIPAAGFTGTDTFDYTVSDAHGSDTGTVTILVQNMVWYVDNTNSVSGDGRSTNPFQSLASLQGASDPDGPGDIIFLYSGSGSYGSGIPLEASQLLIGQPHGLTVAGHPLVTASGTNPVITNSGGAGITLAGGSGNGNTIQRIDVTDPSGADLTGTNVDTLTYGANTNLSNNASGGGGVILSGAGSGNIDTGAAISTAGGHAISVANRTGGTTTFSGATSDTGTGISLASNTGATIHISGSLQLSTGANDAFTATGGGTINVDTGATRSVTTTGGTALVLSGVGGAISLTDLDKNGAGTGISLTNVGASVTIPSGATVAATTTAGVHIDQGTGAFSYAGTITNASGRTVEVTNRNTGSPGLVQFTGSISSTGGTGVNLDNNDNGTVTFSGGLVLSTGTNTALNATNGGTFNVTGSGNTITTTTGAALNIMNTTIGSSGVTFKSINTSGASTPITISSSSGNLTVTGDGTGHANASGGTLSGSTTQAAVLMSVSGTYDFSSMDFNTVIGSTGDVYLNNSTGGTGTVNFTGDTFTGDPTNSSQVNPLLWIVAGTNGTNNGASASFDVEDSFFNGGYTYALLAQGWGNGTVNGTVNQSGFGTVVNTGAPTDRPGAASAVTNAPPFNTWFTNDQSASVDYTVSNSTFLGADGLRGAVYSIGASGFSPTGGHLDGTWNNNQVGENGVSHSGCSTNCAGLGLLPGGGGTFKATVTNNAIYQVNSVGINFFNSISNSTSQATFIATGNALADPDTTNSPLLQRAITVSSGNSGGANTNWCAEVGNWNGASAANNISGAWQSTANIRVTNNNNTHTLELPGLTPTSGATATDVQSFVSNANGGVVVSAALGTAGIVGGTACP